MIGELYRAQWSQWTSCKTFEMARPACCPKESASQYLQSTVRQDSHDPPAETVGLLPFHVYQHDRVPFTHQCNFCLIKWRRSFLHDCFVAPKTVTTFFALSKRWMVMEFSRLFLQRRNVCDRVVCVCRNRNRQLPSGLYRVVVVGFRFSFVRDGSGGACSFRLCCMMTIAPFLWKILNQERFW